METVTKLLGPLMRTGRRENRSPYCPLAAKVCALLQEEGLIRGFRVEDNKLRLLLKHYRGAPVIRNVRIVSCPMRRIYVTPGELKERTKFNTGLWIVSTPYGVVSHRQAIQMGLGGTVLMAVNNGHQHWS